MKKTIGVLLIIFCLILGTVVSSNAFSSGGEGSDRVGDSDSVDKSGTEDGIFDIHQYKISLYKHKEGIDPKKTNGYEAFECVGRKIYFRTGRNYKKEAYVTAGDKFEYATKYNKGSIGTFAYSKLNSGIIEIGEYAFPKYNAGSSGRDIERFFSKENVIKDFVNDLSEGTIDYDRDTCVLIVEPILGCRTYPSYPGEHRDYYLTVTELALSYEYIINKYGDATSANDYIIVDGLYNPYYGGGNPGWGAINYVCERLSIKNGNGNWLGLSNSTAVNNLAWVDLSAEKNDKGQIRTYKKTKENWKSFAGREIIRYGGANFYYSQAFDYPDYTVEMGKIESELWENQTITVRATIKNNNPARGNWVNVTLYNEGGNITFVEGSNQTQKIQMYGEDKYTVEWTINVGTYGKTITSDEDRKRTLKVVVEALPDANNKPTELITNNNETDPPMTFYLKRDFSVHSLTVNGQNFIKVNENQKVSIAFCLTNNNPYKGYEDVPVTVKLKRTSLIGQAQGRQYSTSELPSETIVLGEKVVSFGPRDQGGTRLCQMTLDVGNVSVNSDQIYTVIVEINPYRTWHEPNYTNNITNENKCGKIIVQRTIIGKLGMQIIAGEYSDNNASITTGGRTTGMVTCVIQNKSGFNMYPTNSSKDRLYAELYSPVGKRSGAVCVPSGGTNITWFQFQVPNSSTVTFTGKLIWIYEVTEYHTDAEGNVYVVKYDVTKTIDVAPVTAPIRDVTVNAPDDTNLVTDNEQLVGTDSSEYSSASAYVVNRAGYPRVARWEQWKMNGHTFVLHRYALAGEVKRAVMTPANFGQNTEYVNSNGQIASGSAFTLDFQYDVMTESSRGDAVSPSAYTLVQNGIARFPEFKYQLGNKKTRTLFFKNDSIDSKTMFFNTNQYADDVNGGGATPENHIGQRVHFTPLNMPDGKYKVAVEAYDLWTPAGMIYVISTPSLEISGSIFDYNYMN